MPYNIVMKELYDKMIECRRCELSGSRANIVFGDGDVKSSMLFIGEAPGAAEDLKGIPFVGDAGKYLDSLLESVGVNRCNVYITNMIKCRPPNNRTPLKSEIDACSQWLDKQIKIIKPRIIAMLGAVVLNKFLPAEKISHFHGKAKMIDDVIYFALYHPAAILHNRLLKPEIEEDFRRLALVLKRFE